MVYFILGRSIGWLIRDWRLFHVPQIFEKAA